LPPDADGVVCALETAERRRRHEGDRPQRAGRCGKAAVLGYPALGEGNELIGD
jgi:hypothetical protein